MYSFDSSRVKCLGLIKDLCVNLAQIPAKNLVMDIVVVDIPPKYGMLLSRSWGAKIQGNLQLDMSYDTIHVFSQTRRLNQDSHMKYMVSSLDRPNNTPMYSIHSNIDSFILCNEEDINEQVTEVEIDLGTLQQLNHALYDELDNKKYHDPEQPYNDETELEFLQIENETSK